MGVELLRPGVAPADTSDSSSLGDTSSYGNCHMHGHDHVWFDHVNWKSGFYFASTGTNNHRSQERLESGSPNKGEFTRAGWACPKGWVRPPLSIASQPSILKRLFVIDRCFHRTVLIFPGLKN